MGGSVANGLAESAERLRLASRAGVSLALLVTGLAIASRLILLYSVPMAPLAEVAISGDGDTRYYVYMAQHLASTGEYAQWNLRAYMPPGYAFFLSRLLRLGADSRTIQVAQNLLFLLAVLALATLASQRGGWLAGVLVGILTLASPSWLLLPQKALSETLFLVLLAIAIFVALAGSTAPGIARTLIAGVVFGLAALVRETGLLLGLVMALVIGVWLWREHMRRRGVALAATLLLGIALAIFPWSVRNYSIFGHIVPICLNGPINLYVGNNPDATGVYQWRLPPDAQAVWNRPDHGQSNELFASQLAGREAVVHIIAHPGHTVALMPRKLWALWGPPVAIHIELGVGALLRLGAAAIWFTLLGLGLFGLWGMWREPLGWFIIGACLTATLLHAVTFGDVRFRAAYEYLLILPAGLFLANLAATRGIRPRSQARAPRTP